MADGPQRIHCHFSVPTQQDYYDPQYSRPPTLLHCYCTPTYTDVKAMLLSIHSYSVEVPVWVLRINSGQAATSRNTRLLLHVYQCSNCVTRYHIAGYSNLAVYSTMK